jgi:hypothetical protein
MPEALQVCDDRFTVIVDPTKLNAIAPRVRVQQDIARSWVGGKRVA